MIKNLNFLKDKMNVDRKKAEKLLRESLTYKIILISEKKKPNKQLKHSFL